VLPGGHWGDEPASVVVALKGEVLGVPHTTRCKCYGDWPGVMHNRCGDVLCDGP
jgi:hypothetical protein